MNSTHPMSLRTAASILGWGDSEASEKQLRRYMHARVCGGAPDPTYRVGRNTLTTLRRLFACLPELDPNSPDPLNLEPVERMSQNRLLQAMREVAEQAAEEATEACRRCRKTS
jgi:hypothetical protein